VTTIDNALVDREPARAVDLRLVPAAVVVWLSGLVGLLATWWCAVAIGVAGVLAGVLLLGTALGRRRPAAWWARGMGWSLVLCGIIAAAPVGIRLSIAQSDPLRQHAERGAPAHLHVAVTDRPRPIVSTGFGGQAGGVRSVAMLAEVVRAVVDSPAAEDLSRGERGADVLLIAPFPEWSALLPGQQVVAEGVLAPAGGGRLTVAILRVRAPPRLLGDAPLVQRVAQTLRGGLRDAAGALPEEPAGLLPAIVVGDTAALPRRVVEEFRVAGMSHLLAVSGANLVIVGAAVLFLLGALRAGPVTSALAALLAVLGFVVLAGPQPSVLRAAVMVGIALLAVATGRTHQAVPALAVSVIGLVAYDPGMAVDVGFALSVAATAALVVLAPPWSHAMIRWGIPRVLAQAIAVPAAAHVVTAPLIAGVAGQISLVAIVANALAAPVVAPATVLGVVATLVAPPVPWLAELLVELAGPEVHWLIIVARRAAEVPSAEIAWPSGWWGGLLLLAVIAVMAWVSRRRRSRALVVAALVGAALAAAPIRLIAPGWPPAGWSAVACDVGQGDATLLATAEPGRAVLVDTGPRPREVAECLNRVGVTRLPLVVLTHLHADHIGGLSGVLADRAVGAVAVGSGRLPEWAWDQVRSEAARASVPVVWLTAGQRLRWPGLVVDVLGPRHVDAREHGEATGTEINNGSVVLRATTPSGRLLLAGDVEIGAQTDLLALGVDLTADVLKVPHHGSRYTAIEFIEAVRPRVAVISVGAGNRYGHPSPTTMDRLAARGALVLRTDRDGDTAVLPGQRGLEVMRRGSPRAPPR